MAKFILGLLVGLAIGILFGSYFSDGGLNDLTYKARATLARHMPVND